MHLSDVPTDRIPVQRARHHRGPTTWDELAARRRRRRRHVVLGRWLAVFVLLAGLAGAAVIWQIADGEPLTLLREGLAVVERWF
ncbi:hypothetical protein GCM10009836_61390 [Pseudonocardia ailaonensis]|uniref:Uncharacterized protein n=1 Tax=Pseudonocardia ailaonensis TaxID=367279 RepID=A0ABN2NJM5_9PSEU